MPSNNKFPGGLSAAEVFISTLAAIASPLSDSNITVIEAKVGIVPDNEIDSEIADPDTIFDPSKNGTGTPGNDTRDSNVMLVAAVPGGRAVLNAADAFAAFNAAGQGVAGLNAVQSLLNAQPLIPAENADGGANE